MAQAQRIGTRALICGTKAATSCCEPLPCVDCPDCSCFVDDHFVTIPALDFDSLDTGGDDIIDITVPEIIVTMPIVDCVGVGTYDDSPVGLAVVHPDGEVTELRLTASLTLECVDCDCVAYWCLQWQFNIYGRIGGDPEEHIFESVTFHSMVLAPEVDPVLCEPAQTENGNYQMIHCIGTLGADRLCCAQFSEDAVCTDAGDEDILESPVILEVTS